MEEKEYNHYNEEANLPFLLSLPLTIYCKTIKEGLIGAGIVKEDTFIQTICDSFLESNHFLDCCDPKFKYVQDHVLRKFQEGIELLVSIHCIVRKSVFSIVTLAWYGVHGIAQSVKDLTNEEIELQEKPLSREFVQCQERKNKLEKAIQIEEQFKRELQSSSSQFARKLLSHNEFLPMRGDVQEPNMTECTVESLISRVDSTSSSTLSQCDSLLNECHCSLASHCYLLTDMSSDLFYESSPDGKVVYLSSTFPIDLVMPVKM